MRHTTCVCPFTEPPWGVDFLKYLFIYLNVFLYQPSHINVDELWALQPTSVPSHSTQVRASCITLGTHSAAALSYLRGANPEVAFYDLGYTHLRFGATVKSCLQPGSSWKQEKTGPARRSL